MTPPYSLLTLLPGTLSPGGELVLALVTAHLVGDFLFKDEAVCATKPGFGALLAHSALQALLAYLAAGQWVCWQIPLAIFLTHGAIDAVATARAREQISIFLLDQFAHLTVIVLLALGAGGRLGASWYGREFGPLAWQGMVVASGATLCVRVTSLLIGFWVKPYLDEMNQGDPEHSDAGPLRGLRNGGRVIGQWERALIFIFVFTGQPGSVGFLVAAKSIFRFGELKDRRNRMEAEYITIGTLMSFGAAIVWSLLTVAVCRGLR